MEAEYAFNTGGVQVKEMEEASGHMAAEKLRQKKI